MANILISHTHEDGTLLTGSAKGDGVYEIACKPGLFTWRRASGIHIRPSRDRDAKMYIINPVADALRAAGHEVTIDIDNTPRPTAVVEEERAERADERADRYAARADKAAAAGNARQTAARAITDGIPFGQPVQPPGHHSRNAHLRALDRAENHRGKAVENWKKAEHLAGRASGAAANQAHRENPRTTMRRIETLETDIRRMQRELDGHERNFRNGSGEIYQVEKHGAATGERRADLERRVAHAEEQITYWRGHLAEQAESGTFVPWGKNDFVKGDFVRHSGFKDWYTVARVNAKSVSVESSGWPSTISWDEVAGRRRDGMQWDTPNGEPWPVEMARKVNRWLALHWVLGRSDSSTEAIFERITIRSAQRIVLGLALDAADAEVNAVLEGVTDVDTGRQVKAAFVDVYDRLKGGAKAPDVRDEYTPIGVEAQWRMPDREPEDRIAAKTPLLRRDDIEAVQPGDLIVGWYEGGRGQRLMRFFCGPVATVSAINDRRERGDFVTITLVGGQERTTFTHEWFAVHPAGTWEQPDPEADLAAAQLAASAAAEQAARDAGERDTTKVIEAGAHAAGLVWSAAQRTVLPVTRTAEEEPAPWGAVLAERGAL